MWAPGGLSRRSGAHPPQSLSRSGLLGKTGAGFWRPKSAPVDIWPGAWGAWFQSHRAVVYSRSDGLLLNDIYISATCRCVPPDNKPMPQEMLNCRPFIVVELDLLTRLRGLVALGKIGFDNFLAFSREKVHAIPRMEFKQGQFYVLGYGLPGRRAPY